MNERMDRLAAAAVRSGFKVWQTENGGWVFQKGRVTITAATTPETAMEWLALVQPLWAAGLVFPTE